MTSRQHFERERSRVRREISRRLRASGFALKRIADHLGISAARVGAYCRGIDVAPARPKHYRTKHGHSSHNA